MTSSSTISHKGLVLHCDADKAFVRLLDTAECHSCTIKEFCGKADDPDTFVIQRDNLKVGDHVTLWLSNKTGYKAMFWAYVMPFILIATTIIIGTGMQADESVIGLISLLVLVPYFFGMYLLRDRVRNNFNLNVTKS